MLVALRSLYEREPVTGTGTGTLSLTGAAAGVHGVAGTAAGSLSLTGEATGTLGHTGTAAGTLSMTGAASADHGVAGTAAGTLSMTGEASGVLGATGTGTGTMSMAGAATGAVGHAGTGAGTLSLTGAAEGSQAVTGAGSGTLSLIGGATGSVDAVARVRRGFASLEEHRPRRLKGDTWGFEKARKSLERALKAARLAETPRAAKKAAKAVTEAVDDLHPLLGDAVARRLEKQAEELQRQVALVAKQIEHDRAQAHEHAERARSIILQMQAAIQEAEDDDAIVAILLAA